MNTEGALRSKYIYIYKYIDPILKSNVEVFFRVIHYYKSKYEKKVFYTSQYKGQEALVAIMHYKITTTLNLMLDMRQNYLAKNMIKFYVTEFPTNMEMIDE